MDWKPHGYVVGTHQEWRDDIPEDEEALDAFVLAARKRIEPWLSAVFQGEHLNVLIGSGFTQSLGRIAGSPATTMGRVVFGTAYDAAIDRHAGEGAERMGRGQANIEDQFRSALALLDGLNVQDPGSATVLRGALDTALTTFLGSLLDTERGIADGNTPQERQLAELHLQSFLMSFASRSASRERLHLFTTNYDRVIEHGCDLAGLRIIDRFVGVLNPVFRSSRIEIDLHYNPPGIRGEPRFMEGVLRFTKLHGSLDWHHDPEARLIRRRGIPFGAPKDHSDIPTNPVDTVMVYPNPAKDVETTAYPYAELFRDFAAALCRPNSVMVTYGYGFGDDHVNRVLKDMLTIPSTHLVIINYGVDDRLKRFFEDVNRPAQISILAGSHYGDLGNLVEHYLPKPAIDYISGRMAELLKHRPFEGHPEANTAETEPTDDTDIFS
jgi:hypothetical protein